MYLVLVWLCCGGNLGDNIMTTHEQIIAAYEAYVAENEKFSDKKVKAAAARARKALMEITKLAKTRRAEITAEKDAM
jgi:hypothetical protein